MAVITPGVARTPMRVGASLGAPARPVRNAAAARPTTASAAASHRKRFTGQASSTDPLERGANQGFAPRTSNARTERTESCSAPLRSPLDASAERGAPEARGRASVALAELGG